MKVYRECAIVRITGKKEPFPGGAGNLVSIGDTMNER